MKQYKNLIIAFALTIGAVAFTQAQSKVAHIASQELIEAMPGYKTAMSDLEKLQNTYDAEIKTMMTEFSNTYKQYSQEAESKTAEENAKRAEEVQGMQTNINAYRQGALEDLQKKQEDLIAPILEKARVAIQKVGRTQGYQYVMDSSTLLLAEGKDLLVDVKKELGI